MTRADREARIRQAVEALVAVLVEVTDTPATDGPDRLYSVDEACSLLSIGRSALYEQLQKGRIRSVRVGARRLIPASAIRELTEAAR